MFEKLKSLLSTNLGHDSITAPIHESSQFLLHYQGLKIGWLQVEKGIWTFQYTDEFKSQNKIDALIEFPSVNKIYKSENLWPFFSVRIPSLAQPSVQEIIRKEKIDQENSIGLLKRFGEKTISNPFELAYIS